MNQSITTVTFNTLDAKVRELTRQLYALADKRVRITFVKKNGDIRVMDCVPRVQYNATFGITSTLSGKHMVATKAHRDMITVAEIDGNTLRPRTINLRTVIGNIVPLAA